METLLARYFDGDLDEREARDFLEKVESDPRLENELRAYERLLALGKELPTPEVPTGFTERVMAEVNAERYLERIRTRLSGFRIQWAPLAVAAAAVVLAYIGGWLVGHSPRMVPGTTEDPRVARRAVTYDFPHIAGQAPATDSGLQYVTLSYAPADPSVEQVTIAGSFNNWDPNATPMRRKNGVWVTILLLPPGSHEYMFVENNQRWVTDPLAVKTRDDGFGGTNAVLDVAL